MMIMRWYNVLTKEYDIQAIMHTIIYTHHTQHISNENKTQLFRTPSESKWQAVVVQLIQTTEIWQWNNYIIFIWW